MQQLSSHTTDSWNSAPKRSGSSITGKSTRSTFGKDSNGCRGVFPKMRSVMQSVRSLQYYKL